MSCRSRIHYVYTVAEYSPPRLLSYKSVQKEWGVLSVTSASISNVWKKTESYTALKATHFRRLLIFYHSEKYAYYCAFGAQVFGVITDRV